MNAVEIEEAVSALAGAAFDATEFPFLGTEPQNYAVKRHIFCVFGVRKNYKGC
jgi:hypothetical protein